ncbi:TRAP transporter substrate-binding protein DctP [Salinisphaera sp. T31B1]|uniref:TRAP transporter substrate-binding protein DctP n=1 Tax=Salinisphaera sp. T31B1 TaxID=727963 RepID=UPI00333F7050
MRLYKGRILFIWTMLVGTVFAQAGYAQQTYDMVMTNELVSSHWTVTQMEDLADKINARSDGRINAKVFSSASLYNDQEAIAALGTGGVHMVWPVSVRIETIAPETGVLTLPFVIDDQMMMQDGAPAAVGDYLSSYLEPLGIRVFGVTRTADLFFLTRSEPIERMSDLKGKKIRATGGRVMLDLLHQFGAQSLSMPASEMGPAMSQGVIDGILTSSGGWDMVGLSTAPYATLVPGLSLVTYAILMDDNWFSSLPPDLQAVVQQTTEEFVANSWEQSKQLDRQTLDALVERGGKLTVLDGPARDEFIQAAQSVRDRWIDQHPEAWQQFETQMGAFE